MPILQKRWCKCTIWTSVGSSPDSDSQKGLGLGQFTGFGFESTKAGLNPSKMWAMASKKKTLCTNDGG